MRLDTPLTTRQQRMLQISNSKSYLEELYALTGQVALTEALGDLGQIVELCQRVKDFCARHEATKVCDIPFSDKNSERFNKFIHALHNTNSSPVYVWTPKSIYCGAILIKSLDVINFQFESSVIDGEIISFITSDFNDALILDLSSEDNGYHIEIETRGVHWKNIAY